jgi:hypothetical protein
VDREKKKSKMVYRKEAERGGMETEIYSRLGGNISKTPLERKKRNMDSPLNQVQTRSSFDNMAHLAGLESKCSVFKLLLHVTLAKETAVQSHVNKRVDRVKESRTTYRSPLFLELLQSLSVVARSPRLVAPLLILASCPRTMAMASSLERVI